MVKTSPETHQCYRSDDELRVPPTRQALEELPSDTSPYRYFERRGNSPLHWVTLQPLALPILPIRTIIRHLAFLVVCCGKNLDLGRL